MWIQVRTMDGKKQARVDGLSKLTPVEDLRKKLVEPFDAPPEKQMLFYRGKLLVDGHTLFDYNVGLNEIIQIMIRPSVPCPAKDDAKSKEAPTATSEMEADEEGKASPAKEGAESVENGTEAHREDSKVEEIMKNGDDTAMDAEDESPSDCAGSTYRVGDFIDCLDLETGSWYEADIIKVTRAEKKEGGMNGMDVDENENTKRSDPQVNGLTGGDQSSGKTLKDDGFIYHILFMGFKEDTPLLVDMAMIRPRPCTLLAFQDINVGDRVLANYNLEDPDERGYFYDCVITHKRDTRTIKELTATVYVGRDQVPFENCKLRFLREVFKIEEVGSQRNADDPEAEALMPPKRETKPACDACKDNDDVLCKECACTVCGGKGNPELQLICDECQRAYHTKCLTPPLEEVPKDDEWFCPVCKLDSSEVVQAGEKLKISAKKAKMASATTQSNRDWGKGMACAGRTKQCNIVPPNHFGPIPGIEVGTMWKFRVQVSESGVHRPHVAGIHGREDDGAYSIVLSGGYEDDVDDGDEFTYTGSGGRDLSGNKRTAEQSCDQVLTRMNKALAKNCSAPIDSKKGGDAGRDWKKGKPVRVVRNCKGRKHSEYAPEEGNRYDGIYKIVRYWPDKGQSGFIVWRYLLRRDDPIPAPWTKAGKKRVQELGLEMQYPDGWLDSQKDKEEKDTDEEKKGKKGKGKGKKRKRIESDEEDENSADQSGSPSKKQAKVGYKLDPKVANQIEDDKANQKLWAEALVFTKEGSQKFLEKVEELFTCACCLDVVYLPVTIPCAHNICKACLQRSFKAEVYTCPACREDLGEKYEMVVNKPLRGVLNALMPGYENGR